VVRGALSWFEEQFEGVIAREFKRLHWKQFVMGQTEGKDMICSIIKNRALYLAGFCILFLAGLVAVFVARCHAAHDTRLVGNWFSSNGVMTLHADGRFESSFTNRTNVWAYEGTWLTRSNMLIATSLRSNDVPFHDVATFKIIRADKSNLIYSIGDQTLTFVRKQ
jgi:hypothetical protein